MNTHYLQQLAKHLRLKVSPPATEINVLRALSRHALGESYTDEAFRDILAKRVKLHEAQI